MFLCSAAHRLVIWLGDGAGVPRLSLQKGKGKWCEPAMKVWNHLAWQDLGEFGATLACDAWWGCFS